MLRISASPDPAINAHFWHLKHHLNDHLDVHLELQFSPELAHLVYAGSDLFVMPSMFEPCGLAQLIALKYGSVPIVRSSGRLADTIVDRDHAWEPPEQRNGYVFHHADDPAIESAMERALGLWYDYPHDFRGFMLNGMRVDRSWARPGQDYLNIYDHISHNGATPRTSDRPSLSKRSRRQLGWNSDQARHEPSPLRGSDHHDQRERSRPTPTCPPSRAGPMRIGRPTTES